ncbi:helix-turn-helix transcriptional regulator [Nitrospirota bacterium]
MPIILDENPTRKKIIMLLKKTKHLTVAELSRETEITPMAVRQHLLTLEKRGIIRYESKKMGIGRPVFLYQLTEKAKEIFPKSYGSFVAEILDLIVSIDGRKKLDKLFRARKEIMKEEYLKAMGSAESLNEKVKALSSKLDSDGFMVEVVHEDGVYELKQFNCLLSSVSEKFPESCKFELELYRDLLGKEVERTTCQSKGDICCTYKLPTS